ncbi:MAG: class I SAM-dependent methyltransferase [Planctomycetales bacterium]|nr:class I SAM-dependent methyltransferase [Planctomycetales bacterium]
MNDSIREFIQAQTLTLPTVVRALRHLTSELQAEQLPQGALEEMHAFYDRMLTHERYFLHHFAPYLCEVDHWFKVKVAQPSLLDLGCGVGTQAALLAARGARVVGIDNKPERVAAANAMRPWYESEVESDVDVQIHYADAFKFLADLPMDSLDGVFTQFALAYMEPHEEMLRLIARVVRPGGRVLFREFNAGSIYNKIGSTVEWLDAKRYETICSSLGWRLIERKFYWLFPKPIINSAMLGPAAITIENSLANLPIFRMFSGSMTLVFERI